MVQYLCNKRKCTLCPSIHNEDYPCIRTTDPDYAKNWEATILAEEFKQKWMEVSQYFEISEMNGELLLREKEGL